MDISNAQLRQFLTAYFNSEEIDRLCFDYFPRVQEEFTGAMPKSDRIQLLLVHCRQHGERDRLIGALQESRPGLFQQEFELAQPKPASTRAMATPTSRNPRQIFISYAYEDARLAHRLARDLRQRGWQTWLAPDSIQPGEKWVDAISRGLAESGVFLLLISEHAAQSRWVKSETNIAIQWEHERKLRFIPLQTNSRPLANIPAMWQAYQFISFAGRYQDSLAQLLAELEERPYTPPSRLPSPGKNPRILRLAAMLLLFLLMPCFWLLYSTFINGPPTALIMGATQTAAVNSTNVAFEAGVTSIEEATTVTGNSMPTLEEIATPEARVILSTATTPSIPLANASLHDTWTRPKDGMTMVFVPGGTFMMGTSETEIDDAFELCQQYYDSCSSSLYEDEAPIHEVQVGDYWLDQYEVTNSQFVLFLNEEGNQEEGGVTWLEIDSSNVLIEEVGGVFQPKEEFDAHPVIEVSWYGANAYCQWIGGRLPREAEWEYVARGEAGNIFPWGNEFDGTQLNYCDANCEFNWKDETVDDGYARTAPVVSYDSQSWVDAYDLSGNVWEWVTDWYGSYSSVSQNNPTGPADGTSKVLRGGSWGDVPSSVHGANRFNDIPGKRDVDIGFRCAASPGN